MSYQIKWQKIFFFVILIVSILGACTTASTTQVTEPEVEVPAGAEVPEDEASVEEEAPAEETTSGEPIIIGILAPLTGPVAAAASDSVEGWELFWKVRGNNEVAGRPVEWYVGDSANDAATAVTQAKALLEERNADFIVGPMLTVEGMAVAQELNRRGKIQFIPILSDIDITMREKENLPDVVRIAGWNAAQNNLPFGQWVYDQGIREISTIGYDLQFSYDHCGAFLETFQKAGGEVLTQVWHPLTTEDYSPFIAQLQESDPEAVFVCNSGIASVRFVNQWAEFGLKDEIPLYAAETVTDQSNLRSMDDSALGIISSGHFAECRDAPATQELVEADLAEYDNLPSYFTAANYTAADWIVDAIEAVNGDISDQDAFLAAVRSIELEDSALGPMTLDEYDHPIQNIYIREVVKRDDGRLCNAVIDTIPNTSQFWTFDPEEYMSHPIYSQEYQGK